MTPQPTQEWWNNPGTLPFLVAYLAEVGWTARELVDVVASPWRYEAELAMARAGVPTEQEPGL